MKNEIIFREAALDEALLPVLLALSVDWEREESCRGYRRNTKADLAGRRVWVARDGENIVGYLFGLMEKTEKTSTVLSSDTPYFEVEELYVRPAYRGQGIGRRLFSLAEEAMRQEGTAQCLMLSTATKNWKSILHFYLDELDMTFWNARLFKRL